MITQTSTPATSVSPSVKAVHVVRKPSKAPLAFTGANVLPLGALALALIATGAVLVWRRKDA